MSEFTPVPMPSNLVSPILSIEPRTISDMLSKREYKLLLRLRSLSGSRKLRLWIAEGQPIKLQVIDHKTEML